NAGVSVESIERAVGRPIRRFQIAAVQGGHAGGRPSGSQLSFVQPPALVHAARASHGEFGRALERQGAARRARFAAAPGSGSDRAHAHGATERTTQSSSYGTRSGTGANGADARTSETRNRPHHDHEATDSAGSPHSGSSGVGGFHGRPAGDSGTAVGGFGSGRGSGSSSSGDGSGRGGGSRSGSGGVGAGGASGSGPSQPRPRPPPPAQPPRAPSSAA